MDDVYALGSCEKMDMFAPRAEELPVVVDVPVLTA